MTMKLAVEVEQALNLKAKGSNGKSNPYVEAEFAGQRQRTTTKLGSINPLWNETLLFDVPDPLGLPDSTIEVTVLHDHSPSAAATAAGGHPRRDRFLGRVRLTGSSVAPSRSDSTRLLCPLDKRSLFSNVRGEMALRLYAVPDDGHLSSASSAESSLVAIVKSIPSVVSAASDSTNCGGETLPPPSKEKEAQQPLAKEKEKREFHSKASTPASATHFFHERRRQRPPPQYYYRGNHEQSGPSPAQVQPRPLQSKTEYGLVDTQPSLAALLGYLCDTNRDKIKNTYDLVEQMEFLYVRVIRARDLPAADIASTIDPYAEVKIGSFTAKTKHREQNRNPEWEEIFTAPKARVQVPRVEVTVKHKSLVKDSVVGKVTVEVAELPTRVPPDGPVAPQWYRLLKANGGNVEGEVGYQGEIMMAIWMGTQADEAYPVALHAEAAGLPTAIVAQTHGQVYFNPRMSYLRVKVIKAEELPISRSDPDISVKVQLGTQMYVTRVSSVRSPNPVWNEEFMLVASEPFDEPLVLTVMYRPKDEALGRAVLAKGTIRANADHRKNLPPQWFNLEDPGGGGGGGGGGNYGKIQATCYYDNNYHVVDEPTHYISDFQPSAKPLRKPNIGLLALGILDAKNLAPQWITNNGGTGSGAKGTSAYCVAKYGTKWVRTRTILEAAQPRWNEQYSWEVHDPCTVLTVAVFNNGHIHGKGDGGGGSSKDEPLGKIRIRLSTLELDRVYTHYYPLLAVHPSGIKNTGELHLAVRFTSSTSWFNLLHLYTKPTYPKMHYLSPLPLERSDFLRFHAKLSVAVKMARAEPPLRREVVDYILDDGYYNFSMRKAMASWVRIKEMFSYIEDFSEWFDGVRNWKRPSLTISVHNLFLVLLWLPRLIPTITFLYLFLNGAWQFLHRQRRPLHVDAKLAETPFSDQLDEEFDAVPSMRPPEVVRSRYDRLRMIATRVQDAAGDLANHGERLHALLSWKDPRATAIFAVLAMVMAAIALIVPLRLVVAVFGLYVMRHPKLRSEMPSPSFNFFRRLPGKAETLI